MSVQESRKNRKEHGANNDRFQFQVERKEIPNLHSGFIEESTHHPGKSAFFLSVWFSNGQYKCCLMDRQSNEKCFMDIGEITTLLTTLEDALVQDTLDWMDATVKSSRAFGA